MPGKTGQQGDRRIAVRERSEPNREHEEQQQEDRLRPEQQPQRRNVSRFQSHLDQPHQGDHGHEFGKCQNLGDRAVGAEHQRRAEGYEIARHMGGEQALQPEKAGRIDEAGVECQQRRDEKAFHGGDHFVQILRSVRSVSFVRQKSIWRIEPNLHRRLHRVPALHHHHEFPMSRQRADVLLVERGLFASRARAQAAIAAGLVTADREPVRKASQTIPVDAAIAAEPAFPWVSRGGVKLEDALARFGVSPAGRVCLDVGASTGGFTQVLLAHGARLVYALDVGTAQLHPSLRGEPRIVSLEQTDIRALDPARLTERPDFITIDVSFISLKHVLPAACALARRPAHLLALVKPQFEAPRARDPQGHRARRRGAPGRGGGHRRACGGARLL